MRHYNIPVFISHFGCPNSCVFCNQTKINGRETDVSVNDIDNIIKTHLETLPKNSKKEVAFFGGTFTGISMELQKAYLETVYKYIEKGLVEGIRLSTRPDCISVEILDQLKKYGVTSIELGVQSLDDDVLAATDRFYETSIVEVSSALIKSYGFELGIQLMIGLPKSNFENDMATAKRVVAMKPDIARIYPTLVIKGTELEHMYKRGEYHALSNEEAVERVIKIYSLLELNSIKLIRVGLQPSEDLRADGVVIAGPFHPAFRELVENKLYYNFLEDILEKNRERSTLNNLKDTSVEKTSELVEKSVEKILETDNIENINKLSILANERNISRIVGMKRINKIKLGNAFEIKIDSELSENEIIVNDKKYTREAVLKRSLEGKSTGEVIGEVYE